MRTTLNIDDDVLQAAQELAKTEKKTTGKVISELFRKGLTAGFGEERQTEYRGGFKLLPRTGTIVTPEQVRKLLDDE
jgi:hypothetical protein